MVSEIPDGNGSESKGFGRRPFLKRTGALATGGALAGGIGNGRAVPEDLAELSDLPGDGGTVRQFTVQAIDIDIVYNQVGFHQPNAAMYVLEENKEEVRRVEGMLPGEDPATRLIEPLTLRANVGDVIEVEFVNELDERASIHQLGLPYEVEDSDGLAVGYNPDTTVAPGESITYRWYANREGTFMFHDGATPAHDSLPDANSGNVNGLARGLFGSVVVEPEDATWTDPRTGGTLRSGLRADIHLPDGTDHREFVVYYHDPEGVVTADGEEPTFPDSDAPQHVHGMNYRSTSTGERITDDPDCADCDDPVTFYSSWVHGDPGGDNVFETYVGDPTKMVAVGAQLEENHVHHLHGHRWQEDRPTVDTSETDTIDSQSLGTGGAWEAYLTAAYGEDSAYPDRTFEEAFEVGAGGDHGAVGDLLMHCHLFPHYGEGMNALMRINDKEKDDLRPLPNNDPAIDADAERPSWQELVGTTVDEEGEAPAKPPGQGREPTEEEAEYLPMEAEGAPYADPCPDDANRTITYDLVALEADVVYNDSGDHDPDGRVFVLEEDAEAVRNGEMNPEPLVIRANVGDCIEINLTNELPEPVSNHVHFVSYDPLGADSTMVGDNYDSGTAPGETRTYRWYANEEGTIFFHDHMVGLEFGMNGTFATLVVEPEGSEWYDPYSGEPIRSGAQAMIDPPDEEAFREQALLFQDFAPLVDRDGEFVTENVQHDVNAGVMAFNYRNAPYYHRDDADPAYVFSSAVHGDPETPVLEAYEGDPIRYRLVQGAWEEFHNFDLHGLQPESKGLGTGDETPQLIGPSEGFTFGAMATRGQAAEGPTILTDGGTVLDGAAVDGPLDNPDGLPVSDYLFGSTVDDDLWSGMWGLTRVWGGEVDHLEPLPDSSAPDERISDEQLREMGHPAPRASFDWSEYGQKAKLLYGEDDDRAFPPDKDARQNGDTGDAPPKPPSPGDPCPDDAPVREYDVCALRSEIQYNDHGDHDPDGLVYALREDAEAIRTGAKNPEPLIVRANEGDCIEVTLENKIDRIDDTHFQLDFVVGDPEETLGETPDDFYSNEGRLIRFLHGTTTDGVLRRGSQTPDEPAAGCVDSEEIDIDLARGTASVTFTVAEGCDALDLALTSYRTPEDGAAFARTTRQQLVDAEVDEVGPGTYTFTVDLPGLDDQGDDEPAIQDPAHPLARADAAWSESRRVSLHAHSLSYDVQGSDGATVGFNYDQTIAPGESITYRWYANEEFGSVVLWDMADTRSHWHHGAFAQLLVEPEGSTYLDPTTGDPLDHGAGDSAMIVSPDGAFREFAALLSDGMDITNLSGECVVPPGEEELEDPAEAEEHATDEPCNQLGDPEDHGYLAVNYRSEPFRYRLDDADQHLVYSSDVHGDPNTPVFRALRGDPVVFRVAQAGMNSRGISFHLSDHQWPRYPDRPTGKSVNVDDRFIPGLGLDFHLEGGAGGEADSAGDFLYREMKERRRTEAGMWGIVRVRNRAREFDDPIEPLPR